VAAQRMVHLPVWQQGRELLPDGLDEVRSDRGHGDTLLRREASDTPRMIEHPVPALQTDSRSLLPQALIRSGDIVGLRVEADCFPRLLRTVENEKNSKARFWYDKRTLDFEQGWGFRCLLGAMYLQMMLYMTGRSGWRPCKRPHRHGRVIFKSGTAGERRTHNHKEFCSKACTVWWSENMTETTRKQKRSGSARPVKCAATVQQPGLIH
jgi:hypothetical protein